MIESGRRGEESRKGVRGEGREHSRTNKLTVSYSTMTQEQCGLMNVEWQTHRLML